MALINQNSIIGVTSITSPSSSNVLTVHANDFPQSDYAYPKLVCLFLEQILLLILLVMQHLMVT